MNIGVLITRFPPDYIGGAELQARQLARELARRGHGVTVFTRRCSGRPHRERQEGYEICRRQELPIPGLRMFWDALPATWNIARRRPRPDVLVCYQTFSSGLIGVVVQSLLRIPAIISVRGNREYRLADSLLNRTLVPAIYRRAARLVLQSPRMLEDLTTQFQLGGQEALCRSFRRKTSVIPNGIPLTKYSPPHGDEVLFVGRLIKGKGVADLLAALRGIPLARARIVGDGPDRDRLESLAAGLDVHFVGQAAPEEISKYLEQARMLVLPSRRGDGCPNVILEAMAAGLPVVANSTAGIPDVVRHGDTGFLCDPGDIATLRSYIEQLRADEPLARQMGERGREVVESYSWNAVIPQVEQLLKDAIPSGSRHS